MKKQLFKQLAVFAGSREGLLDTLKALSSRDRVMVLNVLKEVSIRDQYFNQAVVFRQAARSESRPLKGRPGVDAKTEPWVLEHPVKIKTDDDVWEIVTGGGQMPEYTASALSLGGAIADLVKQVTRDAIEDEARQWMEERRAEG